MDYRVIILNGEKTKYIVTRNGDIYNTLTNKKISTRSKDKDGYVIVNLTHKSKHYTKKLHTIVADAFIENKDGKPEIHHKNHNIEDNSVGNLIRCTRKEHFDLEREFLNGKKFKRSQGEKQGSTAKKDETVKLIIDDIMNGMSRVDVAKKYKVNSAFIYRLCNKKGWCHLTKDKEFPKLQLPKRNMYNDELKEKILSLLSKKYSPKEIILELQLENTDKMKNYIKTLKHRKLKKYMNESSTTIENKDDGYYHIDINL